MYINWVHKVPARIGDGLISHENRVGPPLLKRLQVGKRASPVGKCILVERIQRLPC